MSDRLEEILRQADLALWPAVVGDLAERVRSRMRRRTQRKRIGGAVMGVLLAGGGVWLMNQPGRQDEGGVEPVAVATVDAGDARAELASLRREIEARQAVVRGIEEAERRREVRRLERAVQRRPSAAEAIARQQEIAAVVILHEARRVEAGEASSGDAALRYRRVVELFPTSVAAEEARERLEMLKG